MYDETLDISGFTLYQRRFCSRLLRRFSTFNARKEISAAQKLSSLSINKRRQSVIAGNDDETNTILSVELSTDENDLNGHFRGKIWIDALTFQVLREVREVTVRPKNLADPVVAFLTEFEYQPSELGTVVPKKIVVQDYALKIKGKDKQSAVNLKTKLTFEYTKFTKSDVEIKGEVK